MVLLCIVCTILFNVSFGKFVMTFIHIAEIGCMIIPKCQWMVIVVNLVKQTWCGFVCARSVSSVPASSCDNRRYASWHAWHKTLQAFYKDFCPFILQGWAELTKIMCVLSVLLIAQSNSSQVCSMGLQSGDLASCSPDSKVHGANMGPTRVLSAPGVPMLALWNLLSGSTLVTSPYWKESRTTRARGEVWRYRRGSGNFPRNDAWQMALRYFAKCPCRAHRWGICRALCATTQFSGRC